LTERKWSNNATKVLDAYQCKHVGWAISMGRPPGSSLSVFGKTNFTVTHPQIDSDVGYTDQIFKTLGIANNIFTSFN
jgi:hypothetical protein